MVTTLTLLGARFKLLRVSRPIVLVGAGGIGAPAAWALGRAGVRRLAVVDDDRVERTNLHRQVLFSDEAVGQPKGRAFSAELERRFGMQVELYEGRALPDTVLDIVRGAAMVLDATDNFPSRFLLADAAFLAGVPIVHAAAVRWQATVMAVGAEGRPCYRCLFEDLPSGAVIDCATAGVLGPVCGVSGAIAADRVLWLLGGGPAGDIVTYDGRRDRLRSLPVAPRGDCELCGTGAIGAIEASRYMGASQCDAS